MPSVQHVITREANRGEVVLPRTQDYYERRIKEGKTRREIVPCLRRYAAREVFHLVRQLQSGTRS